MVSMSNSSSGNASENELFKMRIVSSRPSVFPAGGMPATLKTASFLGTSDLLGLPQKSL